MAIRYALRELAFRRSRSLVTVASIAVAVLAAVLLTALAASYARAIGAPVETVGADVVVQITGDIPPKLEGLVFPHPNALVPGDATAAIAKMPGVISVTRGVYIWELAPDRYQSVLGIEDGEAGLGSLAPRLIDGKTILASDRAVVLDSDFAAKNGMKVGAELDIGGTKFPVAGIVDAARGGKAAALMSTCRSRWPSSSPSPRRWSRRFIRSRPPTPICSSSRSTASISKEFVGKTVALLGKKGIVSSELSFREALSGVLFLSQRMGLIVAVVIGAFAAAFVLRATASAITERRREMAVLQAVGWPWRRIREAA